MHIDIALGIVLHPTERRVLTAKRPEGVHLAGYWEFPGGKVLPGESAAVAAVREVLEETGLEVVVIGELLPVVHTYPERTVKLLPFLCRASAAGAIPKTSTDVQWVAADDIMDIPFPDGNRSIVEELSKLLETVADFRDL